VSRRFVFIGVTTGSSSIMRIFPRWRDLLGLGGDVEITGHDIPVEAPPERYREAVVALRDDPGAVGALVTTHKIGVYEAARDLFEATDELAELCREVSCIASRDGTLRGWAKDPIAAGRSLERVMEPDHFREGGGHALCMGAGGSGTAITLYLCTRRPDGDAPERVLVTDRSVARLERLAALVERIGARGRVELVHLRGAEAHDRLVRRLPPRSLVVNATGMGKDVPGSPLGEEARFPVGALVWELNYRGELGFLHQARAQEAKRLLTVEDGWAYFINGWSAVMEEVFERRITDAELDLLAREAEFARPDDEEGKR
jgi:shikimate dehydrogenase